MKAILVIDTMPKRCADCPLRNSMAGHKTICYSTMKDLSNDEYYKEKPNWCPLKDINEHRHTYENCHNLTCRIKCEKDGYKDGYNKAIEKFAEKCNQKITEFVLEHKDQLDFASGVSVAWNIIDEIAESMKGEK